MSNQDFVGDCPTCGAPLTQVEWDDLDDPSHVERIEKRAAAEALRRLVSKLRKFADESHTRLEPFRVGFVAGLKRSADIAEKLAEAGKPRQTLKEAIEHDLKQLDEMRERVSKGLLQYRKDKKAEQ